MLKFLTILLFLFLAIAIWQDPSILKPWETAGLKTATAVGQVAKHTGEVVSNKVDQAAR